MMLTQATTRATESAPLVGSAADGQSGPLAVAAAADPAVRGGPRDQQAATGRAFWPTLAGHYATSPTGR